MSRRRNSGLRVSEWNDGDSQTPSGGGHAVASPRVEKASEDEEDEEERRRMKKRPSTVVHQVAASC